MFIEIVDQLPHALVKSNLPLHLYMMLTIWASLKLSFSMVPIKNCHEGSWVIMVGSQPMLKAWWTKHMGPRQNGRHFADDTFKHIFLNENARISIKISLKFVPKGPINNIPALVQIMAWRRPGDKPLSEPMMVRLPTHICVAWPQWDN